MGRFFLLILFTLSLALGLAGCTTPDQASTIPWNRPESWEGQGGAMGGMMQGTR